MEQKNIVDLVIERKQFRSWRVISRGKFSATIEVDHKEKPKKAAILILSKQDAENKKIDFQTITNPYTLQVLKYEYMCKLQTYLIYTETTEHTFQDKVADKAFRKSPDAIVSVSNWIKEISLGLKKIHSNAYVHLNIHLGTIMITTENRAKIGGFDFARHTSTQNNRFEIGSKSHYQPPEIFGCDCAAIDGEKYDTWCLAILAVESLTNNYIGRKSDQVVSWPLQYSIMHKILQRPKFKKIVKKTYSKATKGEYLEYILHLIKHTIKFHPKQRPNMNEFSILWMELVFLQCINNKQLVEEEIWNKKVPRKELEVKMLNMALEKIPQSASKKEGSKCGEQFIHRMSLTDENEPEKVFHSRPRFQESSSNIDHGSVSIGAKDNMDRNVIVPCGEVLSNTFSKDLTMKEKEIFIPKEGEINSNNEMTGDFIIDECNSKGKATAEFPFEHTYAHDSEAYWSRNVDSESEKLQIDKNEGYETFSNQIKTAFEKSDNIVQDIMNNNTYIAENHDDVVPCESGKHFNEAIPEKKAGTIFTTKMIFQNVVRWALDVTLYAGVINHGSYINKLSKCLTG